MEQAADSGTLPGSGAVKLKRPCRATIESLLLAGEFLHCSSFRTVSCVNPGSDGPGIICEPDLIVHL